MRELVQLENDLAEVMSLADISGALLDRLQRLTRASGALLFAFDGAREPIIWGGSLADAMRSYTPDLFAGDPLQAYSLTLPPSTFLTVEGGDFDARAYVRSRAYADFYRPHEIGFVQGVWPTGLSYGAGGMFGLLLSTPDVSRPLERSATRLLKRLETPFRAMARRIARYVARARERDVLGQLLSLERGAFVLWDHDLRVVWASPEARQHLDGLPGAELGRAASLAQRQLRRADAVPLGSCILGRPRHVVGARGAAGSVEFSCVRMPDHSPWLLAELRFGEGIHAKLALLTAAERRVLVLLERGLSNRELAHELSVSVETIRTHVSRILAKLEVNSRSKAAVLARDATQNRER